jgi:hypothetical protein
MPAQAPERYRSLNVLSDGTVRYRENVPIAGTSPGDRGS